MVDIKGEDDESIDSALSQQVNAENSSKEDKLETTNSDAEKPTNKPQPDNNPEKKPNSLKIIIIVSIIVFAAILLAALIITVVMLLNDEDEEESRLLNASNNIREAKVVGEETAYITLADSVNLTSLEEVEIIFSDAQNNQHVYNNSQILSKYEISASSAGLSSFDNITSVSASFTYKSTPSPPVNNTNTTNTTFVMCVDSCTSLGKKCGNWNICNQSVNCGNCTTGACNSTGQCSVSCFDQCGSEGVFCQGNMTYNCSRGADNCLYRTNLTQCGTGQECRNGTCAALPVAECSSNSTCFSNISFTNTCSIGFCNSTGKCRAAYNSSAQICRTNTSECEIAVNCTGSSGTCPEIINKTDGTVCSLGKCSIGRCVNCTSNSDCSADGCSGTEYRDYSCNSTNSCQHSVITKEENLTNGNCNDGLDNDCDGVNDTAGGDTGCVATPVCGNNIREGEEFCDGTDLGGKTCTDFPDYPGGTLACLADCSGYDTSGCEGTAPSMSLWARLWQWLFG